ncbi:hypothetical protein FA15DRAFT_441689 [Coprinopsis marcescibilis]|uniref:F-box domain-containing protein n=1 Tax=Coprinopsis marcescibilis TaxID=230819 RepID=A0A5C3KUI3_COPMA|nr:hypothetical protein FA15DRAFT_441689 [Coprinopsis marcescibilis]
MLDTLDALQLPGLASFSFTFHTGFIEAHIIELNLRHLIIFLRKTVGLKELAIRVDETSCNLNLGFLFMHLGTLEYLEKLSLMMPPLDRFDASHPDILFPIISFIRGHRDKLLDITLKSNAMFVFGTPTDSEVHCWPWRLLDAINFESLVRLDVGAVPFNWLVEFLRSHRRTLHHLTLSADVFPFLPDRLLSLDRELSDSPLGLSRIREVSLTLRSLTPRLLVYILKHFPAAQHLAISYLTTPPPSTFYEQLRKMLIEEGVATSLERTFEFTTVRIRGIVEGPELLQFIYQALQETIGGIVCQGDFVDDEDE